LNGKDGHQLNPGQYCHMPDGIKEVTDWLGNLIAIPPLSMIAEGEYITFYSNLQVVHLVNVMWVDDIVRCVSPANPIQSLNL
jgi:hypothetical protein